jgi:hypothetical protein
MFFVHPDFSSEMRSRDTATSIAVIRDEIGPTVDLEGYFARFDFEACRLEVFPFYDAEEERADFTEYLTGRMPSAASMDEWCDEVREAKRHGRTYKRLRLLSFPLGDYHRFEIDTGYRRSVMAGEIVKYFAYPPELKRGLGTKDLWLFDGAELVIMEYRGDGSFAGARLADTETARSIAAWWEYVFRVAPPIQDLPYWRNKSRRGAE